MNNTKAQNWQKTDMEGFTISLALIDALPVLLFSASSILISFKFQSILFTFGVCCIIAAGMGKVIWKLLLAFNKNNIKWLNQQFRYMMLIGFIIVLLSIVFQWKQIHMIAIIYELLRFPSVILFSIGILGIITLGVLGKKLDSSARSNWIEQITNIVTQGTFFIGLLLLN